MLRWHRIIGAGLGMLLMSPAAWPLGVWQTLDAMAEKAVAPDFELADVDGRNHRLADYRGRVVVVSFWATWCPPCRDELPSMQRAWEQLRDEGLVVLAIAVAEGAHQVRGFAASLGLGFPMLLDAEGGLSTQWRAKGLPTAFVIDRQGRIAYQAAGPREWDHPDILSQLQMLLAEPGQAL